MMSYIIVPLISGSWQVMGYPVDILVELSPFLPFSFVFTSLLVLPPSLPSPSPLSLLRMTPIQIATLVLSV